MLEFIVARLLGNITRFLISHGVPAIKAEEPDIPGVLGHPILKNEIRLIGALFHRKGGK